jgi:protein-disulfide isomerase
MTSRTTRRAALLGVAVAAASASASAQQAQPAQPPFQVTPPGEATPRPIPAERFIGREDALVTVIEYHSLTCGNCARFHTEFFPRIKRAFIEPGLVRFALRDFPLDRIALDAAAAAHCAGPERFEAIISTFYTNKESWAHSQDPRAWLRRTATLAGVPTERLEACWSDRGFLDPIIQSRLEGTREFGVNATPSFVIGGRLYPGVLTFERFSEIVRPLLPAGAVPRG